MLLDSKNISGMEINNFLGKEFSCGCGKKHFSPIEKVIVENGAMAKLPEALASFGYNKIYLVADENTYKAAGEAVEITLSDGEFKTIKHIYKRDDDLVPDERAVGELLIDFQPDVDVILAVGSGVINDLCKYLSHKVSKPYIVFATATSMDGYASDVAAFNFNRLKVTLPASMPKAIIADVEVLKKAPMEMLAAGFGDILGKYSAINDWKLGHAINCEYYCEAVAEMINYSISKCTENAEGLLRRDDTAVKNLMEGLVISGIAMSYTGNSRPASGAEHHLSHFWEMLFLFEGRPAVLHGVKVGIGTIAINWLRKKLSSLTPDFEHIEKNEFKFDRENWLSNVNKFFGPAASGVIELNSREGLNDLEARLERVKKARENWGRIVEILKSTPETDEVANLLKSAGLPVKPQEIGIERELFKNAVIYAKELRSRYTILQLLWDLGLLDEFAEELTGLFYDK